jgi:hypothetical protein
MPFTCIAKRGVKMDRCGRRAAWTIKEKNYCTRCAADLSWLLEPGEMLMFLRGMGLGAKHSG